MQTVEAAGRLAYAGSLAGMRAGGLRGNRVRPISDVGGRRFIRNVAPDLGAGIIQLHRISLYI